MKGRADTGGVRLSIVVVTYNSAHVICSALAGLPLAEAEIIVVDNNSTDNSCQVVEEVATSARVLRLDENVGFARAVNHGVRASAGDVILLLNPDAIIGTAQISEMMRLLSRFPDIRIASPLVIEGSGELATVAGGYQPDILRMFMHASGLSRLAGRWPSLRGHYLMRNGFVPGSIVTVNWVSGGCMFIRREAWEEMDGLTERWFMYAEDVELGLRVTESGGRVVLASGIMAHHAVGGSSAGTPRIRTVWLENLFDLYQSHYGAGRIRQGTWKAIVATGYLVRVAVARARTIAGIDSAEHDARRFAAYSRAALTAQCKEVDSGAAA